MPANELNVKTELRGSVDMKMRILIGISAVLSLGAAQGYAEQQDKAPVSLADTTIACAQERGETLGHCSYDIARDEAGKTTVTVIFANGFKRRLFFQDGKFVKASVTMSGVGTDTDWNLREGTHIIRVEGQRYEVPDILIAGE